MSSKSEFTKEIMRLYEEAGNPTPATTQQLAEFAVSRGLFTPKPSDPVHQCIIQLSQGFREEYFIDSQGRRVRRYHAVRKKPLSGDQQVFWDDMYTAPREHMELSFAQRRNGIVGDCKKLKRDVDSYNDAHLTEPPFQMVLDFTDDVNEAMGATAPIPIPSLSGPSSTAH